MSSPTPHGKVVPHSEQVLRARSQNHLLTTAPPGVRQGSLSFCPLSPVTRLHAVFCLLSALLEAGGGAGEALELTRIILAHGRRMSSSDKSQAREGGWNLVGPILPLFTPAWALCVLRPLLSACGVGDGAESTLLAGSAPWLL